MVDEIEAGSYEPKMVMSFCVEDRTVGSSEIKVMTEFFRFT